MHAVFIHGWKGWPENCWFPWARRELESRGWTTEALALPTPILPHRDEWVPLVRDAIRSPETVLIGHSLGTLTLLLALEQYGGPPITHAVCVSGFGRHFGAPGLGFWIDHDIDFDTVRARVKRWSVIHAKDDYLVPFEEGKWLAEQLHTEMIALESGGHLMNMDRMFELPSLLACL